MQFVLMKRWVAKARDIIYLLISALVSMNINKNVTLREKTVRGGKVNSEPELDAIGSLCLPCTFSKSESVMVSFDNQVCSDAQ